MKRYDSYKDSGVEWIGEIPSGWNIGKLKHLCEENLRSLSNSTNPNYELNYIEISDVNSEGVIGNSTPYIFSESPSRCRRIVQKGDVIVSTVRTYLKSIGHIENEVKDLICSTGFSVLTSKEKVLSKYLFYLIRTDWFISKVISKSEGVSYPSIQSEKLMNIDILYCSISEQQQIVSFLDTKTSLIDSLIEKTQQKIELLKEKRISIINEVVTKGLNPNVEMKDSGVEWIGEIPSHWEFLRLNNLGDFSKGKGITKDKIKESGHKCIRCGEIYTTYELRFNETNSFIDDETSSESVLGFKGVLLFTGDGESLEEIGKCVVYEGEEELYIGGGINVFTPKQEKVIPVYLSYVMSSESVIFQKSRQGKGEIVVHIYSKQLKEIRLGLPPFSEQQQIVEYLDEQTQLIDKTTSNEEKRIELLKEYRQSLISEVVNGKRKVLE